MGFIAKIKKLSLSKLLGRFFRKRHLRIGIYGPPNSGKTTLANRLLKDWVGELMGPTSPIPHETRRARMRSNVMIKADGYSLRLDIVDTPGIATKVDFHNFMDNYGLNEEESRKRAKEATEGVIEAIKWLDNLDGVLLVMDTVEDPFTQVNITILGNLEARKLPVLIVANKIDLPEASPDTVRDAFPQHPVVPISALTGYNIDMLYRAMVKRFR
jgi:hypothetical protein